MSSTRLLILGVLRLVQPAHGYRIRQQLEAWQADEWANVAFGSIYFALRSMEQDGLVRTTGIQESSTPRTSRIPYELTEQGEREFHRLLDEQWSQHRPLVDPFLAGLAFLSSVPRDRLLVHLRERRDTALRQAAELEANSAVASPPHVAEILLLPAARLRAEAAWAEATIAKVERGDLP